MARTRKPQPCKPGHKAGPVASANQPPTSSTRPAILKNDSILAAQANCTCPILKLPAEIITSIVLRHLHPREAIFLSLTCRQFFHGVLSANNYFLWYKVGRFEEQLPGYRSEWSKLAHLAESSKAPEVPVVKKGKKRVATEELQSPGSTKKPRSVPKCSRKHLENAVKHYSADGVVIDYKRLLVETMLGDADMGCQWCLERPMTRKIYPSWGVRLCEECFHRNVISVFACKPLNLDISHLPVEIQTRRGGVMHGIWKPSVQRIVNALSQTITPEENSAKHRMLIPLPTHPTLLPTTIDSILFKHQVFLSAHRAKVAQAKTAKLEELNDLRKRHVDAIFDSIKQKYTDMYNAASAASFRGGDRWSWVMEKLPPDALKQCWFIDFDKATCGYSHFSSEFQQYQASDPLMKLLKRIKSRKLYQDQSWVDSWADRKLARMQEALLYRSEPGVIPDKTCFEAWEVDVEHLVRDVKQICKEWHLKRFQSLDPAGAEIMELFTIKPARKGHPRLGLPCPWSSCHNVKAVITPSSQSTHQPKVLFSSIQQLLTHMGIFHQEILIVGDLDWLLGRPSRWWLRNTVQGEDIPGMTEEDEKSEAEWFREDVQQEIWLREWWGEKWSGDQEREELRKVLKEWKEKGGFWGHSRKLSICAKYRETSYPVIGWCLARGCTI